MMAWVASASTDHVALAWVAARTRTGRVTSRPRTSWISWLVVVMAIGASAVVSAAA